MHWQTGTWRKYVCCLAVVCDLISINHSIHPCTLISRHDEWIGHERIIGRGAKQTRKRTIREPTKSIKPTPKPAAKPIPKPVAKKNGKNEAGHIGRPPGSKGRKRTPSPTMNMAASGRNGNGRACKNRKDNASEKMEPSSEGRYIF